MDLYENTPATKVNIAEMTAGKKVIIFGVPGAFTPGCSKVFFITCFHCLFFQICKSIKLQAILTESSLFPYPTVSSARLCF